MVNQKKAFDENDLVDVESLAFYGVPLREIARMKGVSVDTLKAHAQEQIQQGRDKANITVAKVLLKMAVSGKHPNITILWLKQKSGWFQEDLPDEKPTLAESLRQAENPLEVLQSLMANSLEQTLQGKLDPRLMISLFKSILQILEKAESAERQSNGASSDKPIYQSFFFESTPIDSQEQENP